MKGPGRQKVLPILLEEMVADLRGEELVYGLRRLVQQSGDHVLDGESLAFYGLTVEYFSKTP